LDLPLFQVFVSVSQVVSIERHIVILEDEH
jgi:hypothetical protein